jgi:hypothetical protein
LSTPSCPRCSRPADVKSRHVAVSGSVIQIYCSDACLRGAPVIDAPEVEIPRRSRWWLVAGIAASSTCAALVYANTQRDDDEPITIQQAWVPMPVPPPPPRPSPPAPKPPSPEEEARRADEQLVTELAHDAWIHPLAGPRHKMPVNHQQAFGAAREGAPPPECLSGHCGVDIGAENIWGEPVHAVHDGVIDWVNRGPNEDNGGIFVKIAHKDNTLFSWYFHLAAVPRWVRPGAKVKVGQIIGLVGDTGVKQSAPHLHFAMTVKPQKTARERYIDPESLIAIWPLWIIGDGNPVVSTAAPPGMPVRSVDRPRVVKPAVAPPPPTRAPEEPGSDAPADAN